MIAALPGLDKESAEGTEEGVAPALSRDSYRAMIAPEESSHHEPLKCLIQNPVTLTEVPTRLEKRPRGCNTVSSTGVTRFVKRRPSTSIAL
jgi:hypothetical protein